MLGYSDLEPGRNLTNGFNLDKKHQIFFTKSRVKRTFTKIIYIVDIMKHFSTWGHGNRSIFLYGWQNLQSSCSENKDEFLFIFKTIKLIVKKQFFYVSLNDIF